MEDYKKLKADYDRMSAAAQQKIIAEHVATRDAEIAALKAEVEHRRLERDDARHIADLRASHVERLEAEIARHKRALAAGMLAHTKNDDAKRLDLAECRASLAIESEVADVCMGVVEQCRALVEGHACSCWRAE